MSVSGLVQSTLAGFETQANTDIDPGIGYPLWENPSHLVAPIPRLLVHTTLFEGCVSLNMGRKWIIGREKGNSIVLPDQRVSRRHAQLRCSATGTFSLTDLGSCNGSFVNGNRIAKTVGLKDGDRLHLGDTEIDFQRPSKCFWSTELNPAPKTVLMVQCSKMQGEIWREILNSQGISVIWAPARIKLLNFLEQLRYLGLNFPDLLLLDIGAQSQNPYNFCRLCRLHYPELKIILTSSMRTDVYHSERKWAMHQGAIDLLPGFQQPNIFSQASVVSEWIKIVLNALHWQPTAQNTLAATLLALQQQVELPLAQPARA